MVAATFAALVTLGAVGDLRFDATVQASQSARSTVTREAPDVARAELALAPRLSLSTDGRPRLLLSYEPVVFVPADLGGNLDGLSGSLDERSLVLHRATARGEWPVSIWRLQPGGSLVSGEMLLIGEPIVGTAPGQPVATTDRIDYFGAEVTAGVTGEPIRGTTLALSSGVARSGGADREARELMPILETVRATASVTRRITPRHSLGVEVTGNRSRVGEEASGDLGFLRTGGLWSYQITPRTGLRTAAGAAWTYERASPSDRPESVEVPSVLPWTEVSAEHVAGPARPTVRLGLSLEPAVDRLAGTIDVSGTAHGTATWSPFRRWAFGLHGSTASLFGRAHGTPFADPHTTVNTAGISAGYQLAEAMRISASAGSTWQVTDRDDLPEFREDLVVLEFTARVFGP